MKVFDFIKLIGNKYGYYIIFDIIKNDGTLLEHYNNYNLKKVTFEICNAEISEINYYDTNIVEITIKGM